MKFAFVTRYICYLFMVIAVINSQAEEGSRPKLELFSKEVKAGSVRVFDKDHLKFEFLSKSPGEIGAIFEPVKAKYVSLVVDDVQIADKIQVTKLTRGTNFIGLVLMFYADTNQVQRAANALRGKVGD